MKAIRMLCAAALVALAGTAGAQDVTLKLHTFMSPQSNVWLNMLTPWMEKVTKESGGRIKFQTYPLMQLGGTPPQLYDQVKDGVADVVWTLPGYTAGRFPTVEVFELPFTFTNADAVSRALWDYVQGPGKNDFKDVHVIAAHVHGPGVLHTKDKQIKTLADLKDVKLRAPTRLTNKMLAALGASPVGMPLPQIPEAVNKGVIEGAMVPWEVVTSIRLQEIVKNHSETDAKFPGLYTAVFVLAMNKAKYDSLPPDLKKVIDANSGQETSAFLGRQQQAGDIPARKAAVDRGNWIYTIPASELEGWRKASQPVYDDWYKEMAGKNMDGKALYEQASGLIKKYTK
jgi:TRAP-type C4-dicarboxylate transport system substrate-binding protein